MFAKAIVARDHHENLYQEGTDLIKNCALVPEIKKLHQGGRKKRTKDTAMVPSSQPSPEFLEIRLQNLMKMKMGVTAKKTMLGIRTKSAWLWAASSGERKPAIAICRRPDVHGRPLQLTDHNDRGTDTIEEEK